MTALLRPRQVYDHRLKAIIRDAGDIRLAITEISFSNSLIEAWWRSLNHQWLYLNSLEAARRGKMEENRSASCESCERMLPGVATLASTTG